MYVAIYSVKQWKHSRKRTCHHYQVQLGVVELAPGICAKCYVHTHTHTVCTRTHTHTPCAHTHHTHTPMSRIDKYIKEKVICLASMTTKNLNPTPAICFHSLPEQSFWEGGKVSWRNTHKCCFETPRDPSLQESYL